MDVEHTDLNANEQIASASKSRNWQETVAAWERRNVALSLTEDSHLKVAAAYKELGKLDDADRILGEGAAVFPKSLAMLSERGWLDLRRNRYVEALQHWEVVVQLFPKEAVGIIGYAAALRDLRRYALADIILEGGKIRFPGSVRMATDFARIAQTTGDTVEAMRRWRDMIETFPTSHVGYRGVAELLRNTGQLEEAVTTIEQGLAILPKNLELRSFHAWLATYRQEWDEAERRWQFVKDNYPSTPALSKEISTGLGEVKMGRGLHIIDGGVPTDVASPAVARENAWAALSERWESLGEDCEFGLVQRHFGVEPINLLRWTSSKIAHLKLAFEQDFEGVGAIENTRIGVFNGEYFCDDKHFGFGMHTFIRVSVEDEKKVLVTMANRMTFLRRKLLEDLAEGHKSYIYKAKVSPSDELVLELHAAMQRHGPSRLLVVVKADEEEVPGTIKVLKSNVALGYIQEFGNRQGHWDIKYQDWMNLCAGAETAFGVNT